AIPAPGDENVVALTRSEFLYITRRTRGTRGEALTEVQKEIYPDVVDGLEEQGGVPSRLIKTERRKVRQEGTPWEMFAGSMRTALMRSRSRWMTSPAKVRAG
ncbi:MAG: hypothetical protein ACRDK0_09945, partial [Solirubrobacteraceae bacterium]